MPQTPWGWVGPPLVVESAQPQLPPAPDCLWTEDEQVACLRELAKDPRANRDALLRELEASTAEIERTKGRFRWDRPGECVHNPFLKRKILACLGIEESELADWVKDRRPNFQPLRDYLTEHIECNDLLFSQPCANSHPRRYLTEHGEADSLSELVE